MAWSNHPVLKNLQPPSLNSIQFRLTAGVVLAAALSIGGMAGWLNWRLRQILLSGHEEAVATLSQRFNDDVILYEEMMTTTEAVQKVIDRRAMGDTAIWVKAPSGELMAQSETLSMGSWQAAGLTEYLRSLPAQSSLATLMVGDRALAICIGPINRQGESIGTLFIVEDITQNHRTYLAMSRSLVIISGSMILLLAGLIALYVRQSLQPIKSLSQEMTGVTADSLNAKRLALDKAPTEV